MIEFPAKSGAKRPLYTVIRDTREQQGWIFEPNEYCAGTVLKALKTGDYTLKGLEKILCIERKKSVAEFAKNMGEARFTRELERMEKFTLPFIVFEFDMSDVMRWPLGSGIPLAQQQKMRISRHFILKRLMDFQVQYKTKFIFAGHHAKDVVSSLFKRSMEKYGK
jgi:hypothetical protein